MLNIIGGILFAYFFYVQFTLEICHWVEFWNGIVLGRWTAVNCCIMLFSFNLFLRRGGRLESYRLRGWLIFDRNQKGK